jgi:hypothetical protein
MKIDSFYVIPGYTFFYWGFTLPKKFYTDYIDHFKFDESNLNADIFLTIRGRKFPAKIRMARINNKGKSKSRSDVKYPERNVIQVFYDREYNTLKALRKLFIYSYASTIDKSKPKLKETLEFIHVKENVFRIKVISQQETDFDEMFRFLEDKNLLKFWKDKDKKKKRENIILDYSRKWLNASEMSKANNKNRNNVIYILYHSIDKNVYVGKADVLGQRVKKGVGRIGLKKDWDKFMWFEINPDYNMFLEELEHFLIRTFASILKNDVDIEPIINSKIKLVNRQLRKKKI